MKLTGGLQYITYCSRTALGACLALGGALALGAGLWVALGFGGSGLSLTQGVSLLALTLVALSSGMRIGSGHWALGGAMTLGIWH